MGVGAAMYPLLQASVRPLAYGRNDSGQPKNSIGQTNFGLSVTILPGAASFRGWASELAGAMPDIINMPLRTLSNQKRSNILTNFYP